MQTRSILTSAILTLAALVQVHAATMSASSTAPVINDADIANYGDVTGTDKWFNDACRGQTITTGGAAVRLKSISYQVSEGNGAAPTKTYTLRVGKVAGTNFTQVHSETATQNFSWTGGQFMTWTFSTPVLLEPYTTYGIDVGMTSSTSAYQTGIPYINLTADDYSGGTSYTTGAAGIGTSAITSAIASDRIFHLDIERPLGPVFSLVAPSPADNATDAYATREIVMTFSQNVTAGTGNLTIKNLTDNTDTLLPANDSRLTYDQNVIRINPTGLLDWNKNYAIRMDAGVFLGDAAAQIPAITDDTTWNFNTLSADPLLAAIAAIKAHVNNTAPLTGPQISAHKTTIDNQRQRFAESTTTISAVLDLISTYDTIKGPLFVSGFPNNSTSFDRNVTTGTAKNAISPENYHWVIYTVMQHAMDLIYTGDNLAKYEATLNNYKFGSHSSFPGPCSPPANPSNTHTVSINGSFPVTFGRNTQMWTVAARKPTGTYLAPGTIATVTVPNSLVNAGYKIRVGAHAWDLSYRRPVNRLERATRLYAINSTTTKIASPYGGGIYIEVPFGAGAGVVSVTVTGGVRSSYFSAKTFHQTTPTEWTTERTHLAPWADFQSEKFMFQVPRKWIYSMTGTQATQLMVDWDKAMDAINDLMGFDRNRGKETMYCQSDVILRSSVHAPGYPAVNVTSNVNSEVSPVGYAGNYLVRGPATTLTAANIEFHEQGHGFFFPKFGGESESNVNLLQPAMLYRAFGKTIDEAQNGSFGGGNSFVTVDTTAIAWMTVFSFSPNEIPMQQLEKQYQHKGHAKWMDIARIYATPTNPNAGWEKLDAYWRSFMQDDANNVPYGNGTDDYLLRLSRHVGKDIRPLFHFWGIHPQNPSALANALAAENLTPDPAIKAKLLHYKSIVPANNAAFRSFCMSWWGRKPLISGAWEETDHAMQWDETLDADAGPAAASVRPTITTGSMYVEGCAAEIRARIDELVDLYFPTGMTPTTMSFTVAPTALNATAVTMTAITVTAASPPVQYYFENTTTSTNSGWISTPTWTQTGLTTNQSYSYKVKARDLFNVENNESPLATVNLTSAGDITPPSPDPMTFAIAPAALDEESISMTATTATDVNGMEYYFENITNSINSGWQDSPVYTEINLQPLTSYTYRVRARDKSPGQNATAFSANATASTADLPDDISPVLTEVSPADGSLVSNLAANLVATFDEPIIAASGSITLKNLTDSTEVVFNIGDPEVTITGNTLTLNPPADLLYAKDFAVQISPNAVSDLSNNPFAGIIDDTTWSFTAILTDPIANTGGPYAVPLLGSLSLDGSASAPSHLQTIVSYEWDLNNDNTFGDVTGATPAAISEAVLTSTWGMNVGTNSIGLRVTDSAAKTATATTIVKIGVNLTWDANGTTANQTDGTGAWLDANKWWDGSVNASWTSGATATFGNGGAGGAVTLASPTTVASLTFNSYITTGYTLGTAGQTITLNNGITKNAGGLVATIISPITLGGVQTWANNSTSNLSLGALNLNGKALTVSGTGITTFDGNALNVISGAGGILKNGSGSLILDGGTAITHTFSGGITITGGSVRFQNATSVSGRGNVNINGGYLGGRFNSSPTFAGGLGTGGTAIQILGGTSGFSGEGGTGSTFTIGSAGSVLKWGAIGENGATGFFNPSVLILGGDQGMNGNAKGSLNNGIDLNGTTRTITSLHSNGDGATNTGFTISGVISTSTGTAGLTKTGSGNIILGNAANTYNGATTINSGYLTFATLANGGSNSSIGSSTAAASNLLLGNGAILRYTGAAVSTNRSFTINGTAAGHGASLDASGSGAVNFTASTSPAYGTTDQTRTLTLTGNNTGNNILAALIADNGSAAVSLTKSGTGTWNLSNASNSYTGPTTLAGGLLQGNIPGGIATAGGTSALIFNGGVLGLTGDFTRSLGSNTTVTAVNFTGAGGWAAYGADRNVNLGGALAQIVWATPDTGFNAKTLILGATTATHKVILQNGLDLGTAVRTVQTDDGSGTVDGELSGIITGGAGGGLTKTGTGVLSLSNANTYVGVTTVSAGVLKLDHATALPGGIGATGGTSNLTFNGGVVGLTGDFTRSLNTAAMATAATFTGTGGWAAYGADRAVNLGGASASITWATAGTGFNNQTLILGHSTATHTVDLQNPLVVTTLRTVQVDNGSAATDAIMSGAISGTGGGISKAGAGNLRISGNMSQTTNGVTIGGSGILALSGTNTYSGATTMGFNNPSTQSLIVQGMQALSTNTSLTESHAGGTGGHGLFKLLDDSATPTSRSTVNLSHNQSNASQNVMSVFVGNNSTANGGISASTQTGSTIQLGDMNFNQSATGATGGTGLTVTGANSYKLQLDEVKISLQGGYAANWNVRLQGDAPIVVGGNVQQIAGGGVGSTTTLQLEGGAAGSQISGNILNSADGAPRVLNVSKSGASTWTLSGTNTYTGTTTVSAGKLFVNGDQTSAVGNVSVSANATLGGTGIIGGNTTIANTGKLEFSLSTAAGSHDRLEIVTGKALTFSGASTLTITSAGGASPGLYTLVGGGNNIAGLVPATVVLPVGWAADAPVIVGNELRLNITSTGAVGPGPVDHFVISAISSPRTVGTAITGITITAEDSLNATATSFTGTVTLGGTGGFTGTSASFTAGVLTGVSITPTLAGANLTFTVNDGAGHTGTTTIATIQTQYTTWSGGAPFDTDSNNDGIDNGLAFLLGAATPTSAVTLPTVTHSGGALVLVFDCLPAAERGTASLNLQHSSDVGLSDAWTSALVPGAVGNTTVSNVDFVVTDPGAPGGNLHVVATVQASQAASGKLFSRLKGNP